MVDSSTIDGADGYVSAAALTLVLAMATIAGAVTFRSVSALRQARHDLQAVRADYALAGAQERAMALLVADTADGRLSFAVDTDLGSATILAEPERDKLRLSEPVRESDLAALGVAEPSALRARLAALGGVFPTPQTLGRLAAAPLWRACGPSLVSAWGEAREAGLSKPGGLDGRGAGSRLGQVWRLRARLASGWTDERLVRFVGAEDQAGAVIWRDFRRQADDAGLCIGKKAQSA
ncbi:MAG: hypothetical protein QM608_06200 [Caulobacter sp.]